MLNLRYPWQNLPDLYKNLLLVTHNCCYLLNYDRTLLLP
nr:MAG TPA: hypothetical protein [Bacteriophage sp.]